MCGRAFPKYRCAICQAVDAQTLVNTWARIRGCFPEPRGTSIVGFTDLYEAILANSRSKLLKSFHGNFSLRAPDSSTLQSSIGFPARANAPVAPKYFFERDEGTVAALNGAHHVARRAQPVSHKGVHRKRTMSAAGRAKISKLTKERWAKFRVEKAKKGSMKVAYHLTPRGRCSTKSS
jgi:hypothetical protein